MKLDVGASYIIQNDRNMTNQGAYSNPIVPVYLFPRGDDFNLIKVFERWDPPVRLKLCFGLKGKETCGCRILIGSLIAIYGRMTRSVICCLSL